MSNRLIGFILLIPSLVMIKYAYTKYRLSHENKSETEDLTYENYTINNTLINIVKDLSSASRALKCEVCSFAVDVVKNYLSQKKDFKHFIALVTQICYLTKYDKKVCDGAIDRYKDIVIDSFIKRFLDGNYVCTVTNMCKDTTEYESIDDYAKRILEDKPAPKEREIVERKNEDNYYKVLQFRYGI